MEAPSAEKSAEAISAPEDLMREHGVLNRVLLIYEEGVRRLRKGEEAPPEIFQRGAQLVRRFVEDYHEQLEQNFIFPQFEKRQAHALLVRVLRQQHDAGRKLTDAIQRASAPDQFVKAPAREQLARTCEAFCRMYRPHEAREDTVLFPALYKIVPATEIKDLGEQFEQQEHKLFGEEGFQKTVEQVAEIEKLLGIYDLAVFTPKSPVTADGSR
ncbi:MAG TPA: hemerythrin domain-containing protein [Pirellulaceae bacterium]|nr:hemerythrin domain-containing protein [Pirellulaceae bacterium]